MDTQVNYTLVGAFVVGLVACIITGIIWLSAGFSSGEETYYEINMKESVNGLNIDSAVEFNGVNVGSVKKIEINAKDPRLVNVLLSIKKTTPITQGTRATLNTKGFTGIAYVALEDDGTNLKPLIRIAGEHYPVINTAPSFFWRIDTGMKRLNDNLNKVTKALEGLLDEENLGSIKAILIDMKHVTRTFALNSKQITLFLQNSAAASAQLLPLIQNSQNLVRNMSAQIIPATNKVMLNLEAITNNLSEVTREIKANPAVIIRGKTMPPLGPGEK